MESGEHPENASHFPDNASRRGGYAGVGKPLRPVSAREGIVHDLGKTSMLTNESAILPSFPVNIANFGLSLVICLTFI